MTDEEDAMMLAPMEWVAPDLVDQLDEEYEEELGRTRDLAISKEIADVIISTRKSGFHKTVMNAIRPRHMCLMLRMESLLTFCMI